MGTLLWGLGKFPVGGGHGVPPQHYQFPPHPGVRGCGDHSHLCTHVPQAWECNSAHLH